VGSRTLILILRKYRRPLSIATSPHLNLLSIPIKLKDCDSQSAHRENTCPAHSWGIGLYPTSGASQCAAIVAHGTLNSAKALDWGEGCDASRRAARHASLCDLEEMLCVQALALFLRKQ